MELQNKVAIITGGAVRVGRAISIVLAKAGVKIFCVYHSSENEANTLKNLIERENGQIVLFKTDITNSDSPKEIVQTALKHFKQINILINNSALFYPTPMGSIKEEDWNAFHDLNIKAAFFLSQEAGMWMKENGNGRIINIGDTSWKSPWADYIPYAITKSSINTMTQGLAKALAPNVLVNCINPGPVMIPDDYNLEQKKRAIERTLLQKEGTPGDIAKTVLFLAESDYITGASIPVDGGRHIG